MIREKIGKILSILFLCWFVLIPVFWHFDVSKGTNSFYDAFVMAPYAVFHLIIFYAIGAVSLYFNKISVFHFLLFSLYFPVIQLANYPYLTIRDVYLHAAPANAIIEKGELLYLKDPHTTSWPGSFNLHAILAIVSGLDLINTNYILYVSLVIALALVLYSFSRRLEEKGYMLAWASSLLFLCLFFNHLFDNFHHYSRTALAFTLLFFFLLSFICFEGRRSLALQFLMVIAIVTTHPFQSFAMLAFIFAYLLLPSRIKPINTALFSTVFFLGWIMVQGSFVFSESIERLKAFFSPHYVTPIVESFPTIETLPWWGVILRNQFRYSLLVLLAIAFFGTILVFLKRKRYTTITLGLSSLLFSSIVMLLSLLLLPDWHIGRFTPFAAFPAAFSSLILIEEALKKEKSKTTSTPHRLFEKKSAFAILLALIVALSAVVMVLRFERNYYFGELCHPSELSSLSFFFKHDYNSTVYVISWRTSIYSVYFDHNSSHRILRLWYLELKESAGNSSKLLFSQSELLNQSQFVIRGIRDSFTVGRQDSGEVVLEAVSEKIMAPLFNPIYSNDYYSIFKRTVSP